MSVICWYIGVVSALRCLAPSSEHRWIFEAFAGAVTCWCGYLQAKEQNEGSEVSEANASVQEFYCRHCNGEKGGYFTVNLRMKWDRHVNIHCPKCKNVHSRTVKGGLIYEYASITDNTKPEDIFVPLSSWSDTPRTTAMHKAQEQLLKEQQNNPNATPHAVRQLRVGAAIASNRDIINEAWVDRFIDREQEV